MNYTKHIIETKSVSNTDIEIPVFCLVIKNLSEVKSVVEKEIVDIYDTLEYSLEEVKKSIYTLISSKSEKQKHGICAEFFMHLLLRELGYKQKCEFTNLEENSMKKGFDAFYENSNDFWIAESKCALDSSKHKIKIKEALDDIDEKVSNTAGNNPWANAYHHLLVRQTSKGESIAKRVANLSKDYVNNISHKSSEFNLIPVSTLFINNDQKEDDVIAELKELIDSRQIKSMNILCINNDIYDEFIDYLKGDR